MGKSVALVKCKSDNSIWIGRYNGVSDCVETYFEPYSKNYDFDDLIDKIKRVVYQNPPYNEEPCEIYSNYGCGFWWEGTFDRNKRCVVKGNCLDVIGCEIYGYNPKIHNEIPGWARKILEEL